MKILYHVEETNPSISFKAIGHQWYWTYEYSDIKEMEVDSYMQKTENRFRLLDVDTRIVLPFGANIRVIATSTDVIHSWTIPALAIKRDAVPGRINQINFLVSRPGTYFGQCSEICGANHRFMPILIEAVPIVNFISWCKKVILLNGWI
jgi:cytochrome c oxidase subunit 2